MRDAYWLLRPDLQHFGGLGVISIWDYGPACSCIPKEVAFFIIARALQSVEAGRYAPKDAMYPIVPVGTQMSSGSEHQYGIASRQSIEVRYALVRRAEPISVGKSSGPCWDLYFKICPKGASGSSSWIRRRTDWVTHFIIPSMVFRNFEPRFPGWSLGGRATTCRPWKGTTSPTAKGSYLAWAQGVQLLLGPSQTLSVGGLHAAAVIDVEPLLFRSGKRSVSQQCGAAEFLRRTSCWTLGRTRKPSRSCLPPWV